MSAKNPLAAPVVIKIEGKAAAALRIAAFMTGRTPEQEALASVAAGVESVVHYGEQFISTEDLEKWFLR